MGSNISYAFRNNSGFGGDAAVVFEELESIRMSGALTPEEIVNHAENDSSYIHRYFDWNDETAAHEQRKGTARRLTRSIVAIEVKVHDKHSQDRREVYFSIKSKEKDSGRTNYYYQHIDDMTNDEFSSALLSLKAHARAIASAVSILESKAKTDGQIKKVAAIRKKTDDLIEVAV